MASTLNEIDLLKAQLSAKIDAIAAKEGELSNNYASLVEYGRQYNYHVNEGNTSNAQGIEQQYLIPLNLSRTRLTAELEQLKKDKQAIQDSIANKLKSLTPTEKEDILYQDKVDFNKSETDKNTSATAMMAQSTTKYLIIGAIVLTVVVIVGLFFYKRAAT